MGIHVKKRDYIPAPEGLHRAVCCDVTDLGVVTSQWGTKRSVSVAWQIAVDMENGSPFLVTKRYTASLHEKSNLRIDLESWCGKRLTEEQAEDMDIEAALMGKQCQLNIMHNTTGSGTYANIKAIVPPVKGLPPIKIRDYERVCDRKGYVKPEVEPDEPPPSVAPSEEPPQHGVDPDDDIPF